MVVKDWQTAEIEWPGRIDRLTAENAKLRAESASALACCDSYAKENQQFHDTIERLRAALEEIVKLDLRTSFEAVGIARRALEE